MKEVTIRNKTFKEVISLEEILEVVNRLARRIDHHYDLEEDVVLIGILNGAFIFLSDLVRAIERPIEIAFTQLKSYVGMKSTGEVQILKEIDIDIKGKHVVIVEDIIDTGTTIHQYNQILQDKQPKSISIYALLVKPANIRYELPSFNIGFEIKDRFVIGYGLDFDGLGRNLKGIYQLK